MMQNRKPSRREKGAAGEMYASFILSKEGYSLLCRNYTCPGGEVDLIMTKGNYICFVEVKTRSISSGLSAAAAVTAEKLSCLKNAIKFFFEEYRDNIYVSSLTPRIDVFEVYTAKGIVKRYNHITDILRTI